MQDNINENALGVYIDPMVEAHFKAWILQFLQNRKLYTEQFLPPPWFQAIAGRAGVQKLDTILALFQKYNVPKSLIHVESVGFGQVSDSVNNVMKLMIQDHSAFKIIIVDHMDRMCYDSESMDAVVLATKLGEMAKQEGVMVIGLLDRPVSAEEVHQMTPWALKCHNHFFHQFDVIGYAPCPSAEYNVQYVLNRLRQFEYFMNSQDAVVNDKKQHVVSHALVKVSVCMQDDNDEQEEDRVMLRDATRYATQEHLEMFLKHVFQTVANRLANNELKTIDINLDLLLEHMSLKTGVRHVCGFNAQEVEDKFMMACPGAGKSKELASLLKKHVPLEEGARNPPPSAVANGANKQAEGDKKPNLVMTERGVNQVLAFRDAKRRDGEKDDDVAAADGSSNEFLPPLAKKSKKDGGN